MAKEEPKLNLNQQIVDSPYEEGVYGDGEDGRVLRKFAVLNWLDSDIHTKWLGKDTVIKAGEMRECGHAEAYHFMKVIVDKYIFDEAGKLKDSKEREKMEMNVLSKGFREPLEAKTLTPIRDGEESPVMKRMKDEIRKEIEAEQRANAAAGVTNPEQRGEFED